MTISRRFAVFFSSSLLGLALVFPLLVFFFLNFNQRFISCVRQRRFICWLAYIFNKLSEIHFCYFLKRRRVFSILFRKPIFHTKFIDFTKTRKAQRGSERWARGKWNQSKVNKNMTWSGKINYGISLIDGWLLVECDNVIFETVLLLFYLIKYWCCLLLLILLLLMLFSAIIVVCNRHNVIYIKGKRYPFYFCFVRKMKNV